MQSLQVVGPDRRCERLVVAAASVLGYVEFPRSLTTYVLGSI